MLTFENATTLPSGGSWTGDGESAAAGHSSHNRSSSTSPCFFQFCCLLVCLLREAAVHGKVVVPRGMRLKNQLAHSPTLAHTRSRARAHTHTHTHTQLPGGQLCFNKSALWEGRTSKDQKSGRSDDMYLPFSSPHPPAPQLRCLVLCGTRHDATRRRCLVLAPSALLPAILLLSCSSSVGLLRLAPVLSGLR